MIAAFYDTLKVCYLVARNIIQLFIFKFREHFYSRIMQVEYIIAHCWTVSQANIVNFLGY